MAASSGSFHEAVEKLTPLTMDLHRALVSLQEELEAIDWYQQRVDSAADDELREILAHNRDEEKEHAAMVLEWIRRRDPKMDQVLRTYLFTTGNIIGVEAAAGGQNGTGTAQGGTLGSLRGGR